MPLYIYFTVFAENFSSDCLFLTFSYFLLYFKEFFCIMSNAPKERKRVGEILELEREIQKRWDEAKAFEGESPLTDEKYLIYILKLKL